MNEHNLGETTIIFGTLTKLPMSVTLREVIFDFACAFISTESQCILVLGKEISQRMG